MRAIQRIAVAGSSAIWFLLPASAQSDVDFEHRFSWTENAGWMNWADAMDGPDGLDGVVMGPRHMAGWIWCENVGWVTLGDGTPGGVTTYANADGSDAGVNVDECNDLYGYGWSENVGWINFDTRESLGSFDQQASYDAGNGRFRGYAWGENIGWINLDHAEHFVAINTCPADCNEDDAINIFDYLCFQGFVTSGDPRSDCNGDCSVNIFDFLCFQGLVNTGCP